MELEMYREMYEHEDSFWWNKGMRKITYSLLSKYLGEKKERKILDAGCGTGGMFQAIAPFGEIWGIDSSEEALKFSHKRNFAKLFMGDIALLPFEDDFFDVIVCSDVLYHRNVSDESMVLKEFHRVLKHDGILFVREAAYEWLKSGHDLLFWTKRRYTKKILVEKINNEYFEVFKSTYVSFFLFPIIFCIRRLEKFFLSQNISKKILSSVYTTPKFLNYFFYFIYIVEANIISFLNFPFGLSIVCIAKKNKKNKIP